MATIWKFPIPIADSFSISMPCAAEFLFVAAQDGQGCLWARVSPSEQGREERKFLLRGTGHEVDGACMYVGSFILRDGALVFHLFEQS